MMKPQIDLEKCDGCGLCVGICTRHNIILVDGVVTFVEVIDCDWCTVCEAVCPREAISCPFDIVILE